MNRNTTNGTFDEAYTNDNAMYGTPYQELQDYFTTFEPKGSLLDVGCGQGRDALFLAGLGYQVTALDFSKVGVEQMLKEAELSGLSIKGIAGDALKVEFSESFDVILFDMLLHSFAEDEQQQLLTKYASLLNPGGTFCIVFPDNMTTEHFTKLLEATPYSWKTVHQEVINDVPKIEGEANNFTFTMLSIERED